MEFDDRNETISKKVRDAQLEKFNYVVTIGDKEENNKKLAVRTRGGEVKFDVDMNEFIEEIKEEINKRSI